MARSARSNDMHWQSNRSLSSALFSRTTPRPFILTLKYITVILFSFFFLVWMAVSTIRTIGASRMLSITQSTNIEHLWAQYSPYFPVTEYSPPPRDCKISQVSVSDKRPRTYLIHPWSRLILYVRRATCFELLIQTL
jgi:hypothetical protein